MGTLSKVELDLEMRRGKTGVPGEKSFGAEQRTDNKLNPQKTSGPGIEPRTHWGEASALAGHCAIPDPLKLVIITIPFDTRIKVYNSTVRGNIGSSIARRTRPIYSWIQQVWVNELWISRTGLMRCRPSRCMNWFNETCVTLVYGVIEWDAYQVGVWVRLSRFYLCMVLFWVFIVEYYTRL